MMIAIALALISASQPGPIPIKTGNLSVDYLMKIARGQPAPAGPDMPAELGKWHEAGVYSAEDYPCWMAAEPEEGKWDWSYYDANCALQEKLGMCYAVYPWLHFTPKWYYSSERFVPYRCIEHDLPTFAPSIWGPDALWIYDRFYKALREHFGDRIKMIYASMPADYGEVGYPVGMASWVVPSPKEFEHQHAGYWCGDKYARAAFRQHFLASYGSLAGLNAAWGTAFKTPEEIDYPKDQSHRIRWLDFVNWYYDSMTDFVGGAIGAIRTYYPKTPIEIKIGHGAELCQFGQDITKLAKLAKKMGFAVRSTHGKLPYFWYKRIGGACKFYGVKFVTEPPSGVSRAEEVERIFNEASTPVHEYMDYPANIMGALDIFKAYRKFMTGEKPVVDVAFLYPTTDHRLHCDQAAPPRLWSLAAPVRDAFDYDILDERLVADGALASYRVLIVTDGQVWEAATWRKIAKWVEGGGVLVAWPKDAGPLETIEGKPITDLQPTAEIKRLRIEGSTCEAYTKTLGKGRITVVRGEVSGAKTLMVNAVLDVSRATLEVKGQGFENDGVLATRFPGHALFYNSTDASRTVALALKSGAQPLVTIRPLSIADVDLAMGKVDAPEVDVGPTQKP